MMKKSAGKILLLALLSTVVSACYKMPGEDDFSVCPTTNNRALTQERQSMMPEAPM